MDLDIIVQNKKPYAIPASNHKPVLISTTRAQSNRNYIYVPDVRNTSLKKAMTVLRQAGLKVKVEGSGKVLWQSPRPGTIKKIGDICIVHLE